MTACHRLVLQDLLGFEGFIGPGHIILRIGSAKSEMLLRFLAGRKCLLLEDFIER